MLMQINGETAGASEEEVDEGGADVLMPNPGEGRDEFVARFTADGDMIQRFPDEQERSSAAMQKWRFENEKVGGLLGGQ